MAEYRVVCEAAANVGATERWVSVIAGSALIRLGHHQSGLTGTAAALTGASLVARGFTGRCSAYRSRRISSRAEGAAPRQVELEQLLPVEDTLALAGVSSELQHFPQLLGLLEPVTALDARRLRWCSRSPYGAAFDWITARSGDSARIRWRGLDGALVEHHGSMLVRRREDAVSIELALRFSPAPVAIAARVAQLLGSLAAGTARQELLRSLPGAAPLRVKEKPQQTLGAILGRLSLRSAAQSCAG